jgi:hypothetical protein
VLFEWLREDQDIVQVGETEVESPQYVVHEALERLGGVFAKSRSVITTICFRIAKCFQNGIWLRKNILYPVLK